MARAVPPLAGRIGWRARIADAALGVAPKGYREPPPLPRRPGASTLWLLCHVEVVPLVLCVHSCGWQLQVVVAAAAAGQEAIAGRLDERRRSNTPQLLRRRAPIESRARMPSWSRLGEQAGRVGFAVGTI